LAWAGQLHAGQRRVREPYVNHLLRVAIRILCYYRVTDARVLAAALLHDSVEDQPWAMVDLPAETGPPPRQQAVAALTERFGAHVAELVVAVTNPHDDPAGDRDAQYLRHLRVTVGARPWARVLKLSDFTDNGVGIIHTVGPKLHRGARKYHPAVPVLQALLDLPDTPLQPDVKQHITRQLHLADSRFAAILAA
ncbi:MAG TPA: HD domain-containing protein, partial [Catenuloplanes sp.]